ncbi:MAG: deoxyribose-phosphate aldolase [Clostridia bacterium]|nr:deoxyribose-phosphate aldolase [Clostridia bacterium]
MNWTSTMVAAMIDHTNLRADATREDFRKLCDEAVRYGFKSVAINSYPVRLCREMLEGSSVLTGAAIAFPLGQTSITTKAAEAANAIADGCQEFDYVLNISQLREHNYDYIESEMTKMVDIARGAGICCKVIFETCYLTDEEIIEAARIASFVRPDFVKTSTGFGTAGARPEHVALMRRYAGPEVQVKAAGGIRSWKDARAMLEAGATRLGTSSGVRIIEELRSLER